ncbi:MAG: hypothetical protein B7X28_00040 [Halothiobacillus sp. 13-55-253]|jgi:type I restriction enzyme S subunit|nr:MAG: hypothetical protein B7X28_00040 [Halothiobacillus sp. 13-55-253]
MSFPRYPTYKDSGVEWLGEVPEHWGVGSVRWLTRRYSGGTPDKTNLAYWEDGTIPWLNSGAVNDRVIKEPSAYITVEALANSSAKWIPEGALVMALAGQGKTKGMVARLAIPSTCNQSMAAILPSSEISGPFLFWWLDSNYQNIRNMAGGDLRDGLNLELLGNIRCPLPTPDEQTKITAFLDRETAKIDELVAEQQRLMELLKEKRQAIISHAVTKGLNPDAPMKPSGIEWLGDVPQAWIVIKLGRAVFMQEGPGLRNWQFTDEGTRVICVTNITESGIDFTRLEKFISTVEYNSSYRHFTVQRGDVLLSSSGNSWGKVAIYHGDEEVILNTSTIRINETEASPLKRDYIAILLQSDMVREQLGLAMTGSCQPNFGPTHLNSIMVAIPEQDEQSAIVEYLSIETYKLDTLITEAQRAIDLLQERRTALISAAVTGQIDVRAAL